MLTLLKKNQGITLTEVLVVIAILGILASIAVPSYQDMIERNRLKQAVESLADDLKFARTEAIKKSNSVTLAFNNSPTIASTCYGITTGTTCDCTTTGSCNLKTVDVSQFSGITVKGNPVTFTFLRGTTTNSASITTTINSAHYQAGVIASPIGKVTICTTGHVMGYPSCP
jgi:prepilin-type N-terminal cleavage/methylation domain-containing protein